MWTHASRCRNTFAFATANFKPIYNINLSAREGFPDAGLQKRATFSTLIVGLAGPGDQTWATCVAGSRTSRSAIYYNSIQNIPCKHNQIVTCTYLETGTAIELIQRRCYTNLGYLRTFRVYVHRALQQTNSSQSC
jgi:hypothetical protein